MSTDPCHGCGRQVPIAGGIADLWTFGDASDGGLVVELADGSEHFLCFDCVERLPDDREPTAADVDALEGADVDASDGADDGGNPGS